MELKKSEVDAAIGLLKMSALRRQRTSFGVKVKKTLLQQTVLKSVYKITNFPSTETRNEIALLLGISQRSVQVWFQNKRQISKKRDATKKINSEKHFVNEYNKFCKMDPPSESLDEFICDIPSSKLVDIIKGCDAQSEEKDCDHEKVL